MEHLLYDVVGVDELDGAVFARCTTYEKAQRAVRILEGNGFEDILDIVKVEMPIDAVEIDGEWIEL